MKTVAVIPCYNEQNRIGAVLESVAAYVDHIVVVDDGSRDDSVDVIRGCLTKNITLLRHLINGGKGAAVRTGCDFAVDSLKADRLILLDGDGQHDAADIPAFFTAQKRTHAHVVFGTRKRSKNMPLIPRLGNWGLTLLCTILFGVRVDDTQSGFRMLTKTAYRKLRWTSSDYSMESEMVARLGKTKFAFAQVVVKTIYLDAYKGTTVLDGIKIALNLVKWRLLTW